MKQYPIYLDYDMTEPPIGSVLIENHIPDGIIKDCAIVPYLVKENNEVEGEFKTKAFGLVKRANVNTGPLT